MRCHAVNTVLCNIVTSQTDLFGGEGTGGPQLSQGWPPGHPLEPPLITSHCWWW